MNNRYYHLLSPVKIGGVILKNRMISSNAMPHFLQGPDEYPSNALITHYANLAKNGAAMVTFSERIKAEEDGPPDAVRMPYFEIHNMAYHCYFSQLAEACHFYNTKVSIALVPMLPKGYGVSDRPAMGPEERSKHPETADSPPFSGFGALKEASTEMVEETIETCARRVLLYKQCGFDAVTLHVSYRGSSGAQFFSPLCNHRTDKYGGSLENRSRFIIELSERIKQLCGKNFIIEVQLTAEEKLGGTLEDTIAFVKLAEHTIDILQIRTEVGRTAHPTGFNSTPGFHYTLEYARRLKAAGTSVLIAPIGGYQDPEELEKYLSEKQFDMVAMGRAFICDPEYGKKLYENRGEDIVPCLLCNKCHEARGRNEYFVSACSVNPYLGIMHRVDQLIQAPDKKKNTAVIGGGPAGMCAALELRKRGHEVTLYEASDALGGQLKHADYVSFKWPIARYKNYLITQLYKQGVRVLLHTKATPKMITAAGYDAVIFAAGAVPKLPPVSVRDGANIWLPTDVYGHESELGPNVVVVGGSSTGVETGMHLAEKGHAVTVLTRSAMLAEDSNVVHYYDVMEEFWSKLEHFSWTLQAKTTEVDANGVHYIDNDGNAQFVEADSIVLCGGVEPAQEEALSFYGCAKWFTIIGDCTGSGNIMKCTREAMAAASQI